MKRWVVWVLALSLCSGVRGAVAPSFQGETLSGVKYSLKEALKPGRLLLISFWATWCGPCLEELKAIGDKLKAEPSLPLDVVTVNIDTSETVTDVRPTVRLQGIGFPVVLDPKQEILARFSASKAIPFSVLVGPTGKIEASFQGYSEAVFEKIKAVASRIR